MGEWVNKAMPNMFSVPVQPAITAQAVKPVKKL